MSTYLDTSFLLKLYVYEPESATTSALFAHIADPLINTLTDVEMASALFRKLPASAAWAPYRRYLEHRQAALYRLMPLSDRVYKRAQLLAERYSGPLRLRSLDLLHLATALEHNIPEIATYDETLAKGARAAGLSTLPTRP